MLKFDSLLGNVIELTEEQLRELEDVSLDDIVNEVMNNDNKGKT